MQNKPKLILTLTCSVFKYYIFNYDLLSINIFHNFSRIEINFGQSKGIY